MIIFRFDGDPAESVDFTYAAAIEAALSLHVLVAPQHHPLQHAWVRTSRDLPADVRREIGALAFLYRETLPEFFAYLVTERSTTFDDQLRQLERIDAPTAALGFARLVWDHGGEREPSPLDLPDVRAHVVDRLGAAAGDDELGALALEQPERLLARFVALLERYWAGGFADEWRDVEAQLERDVADARSRIAAVGLFEYLTALSPQLLIDPRAREIRRNVPHEHLHELDETNPLVLVPSRFVAPHVRINCDRPWPPTIVYPTPSALADGRAPWPGREVVDVFAALADETRLRALKMLARQPRSTQELAPLLGIGEAGLSRHLRLLARAGLVTTRRHGYYVLYALDREAIAALPAALLDFVDGEEAPARTQAPPPKAAT